MGISHTEIHTDAQNTILMKRKEGIAEKKLHKQFSEDMKTKKVQEVYKEIGWNCREGIRKP